MNSRGSRSASLYALALCAVLAAACSSPPPAPDAAPDVAADAARDAPTMDASALDTSEIDAPVPTDTREGGGGCPTATLCFGLCVDMQTDERNCGRCGAICAGGDVCNEGACEFPCPEGRRACGVTCLDLQTDVLNCGQCGNSCTPGRPCEGGFCTPLCPAPTFACRGTCMDGQSDSLNCGACGRACTGVRTCRAGACVCPPSRTECSGTCADITSDAAHCGRCGNACPAGEVCSMNFCVAACASSETRCGFSCINTRTDAANCGACGAVCPTGQMCANGSCGCPAGTSLCDSACRSLATEPSHCGACGRSCPMPQNGFASCAASRCTPTCFSGFGDCNGDATDGCEADLNRSSANCGACGSACLAPPNAAARCFAGACEFDCNEGFVRSGTGCVALGPPRLLSPPSTSTVSTSRPRLSWVLPPGIDTVRVEVCSDRACAVPVTTFDVASSATSPGSPLPPGVNFWRASAIGPMGPSAPSATWQFTVPAIETIGFESAWGTVSDPNGDGVGDVLVGSATTVFAYYGAPSGLPSAPGTTLSAPPGATGFGRVAVSAGDVNGDGFGDVAVAAADAGRVFLYLGGAAGLGTMPSATLSAPAGATRFGAAISAAGDVDGDGYGDLVVGTEGANRAYLYRGGAGGLATSAAASLAGPAGSACFGCAVTGGGDVDGDAFADVVVGACSNAGACSERAFIYRGSAAGLASTPAVVLMAPVGATRFGASVALAGDVDGDGLADVLVGAPGSARAYVYRGVLGTPSASPTTSLSAPAGSQFGASLAAAGDVNGDAFGDVIVGAPGANAAYVYHGGASGLATAPAVTLTGPSSARFGASVAGARSVDGDGFSDVVVGAPGSGTVTVYRGGTAGVTAAGAYTLASPAGAAEFGAWVAAAPTARAAAGG